MALPSLFTPLLAFIGLATPAYAILNLRLLSGLGKLGAKRPSPRVPDNPLVSVKPQVPDTPLVTILIAARNEAGRIQKCLDCLLAQDYPPEKLQIVVVDDRSDDATVEILRHYCARRPGRLVTLSISETSPDISPKKNALEKGMGLATGEIILTTDADCVMSPSWVSALVAEFDGDIGLVLGMTSYYRLEGRSRLLWGVEALEFLSYGIVAAALIGLRFPVHGNANNIAYRRKLYDQASGFSSHGHIVSGDDDFLIQSIHRLGLWKIAYSVRPESQVMTEPPLSLRHFWEQRKRWASKCSLYEPKQVAFLGAIFTYYTLILACLGLGAAHASFLWLGLAGWSAKTGMDYWVMHRGTGIFEKRELMAYFPITCLLHIPLIIAAVLAGSFGQFTWKGQKTGRRLRSQPGSGR